jgi:hypothetical protein
MDLVLYTLKLRLGQILSPRKDWKSFVFFLLLLGLSVLYAHGIANFLDSEKLYDSSPQAYELLKPGLFVFIVGLTLLRAFLPSYKRLTSWVQPFQPISKPKRYALKLLSDFSSSYFLSLSLAILYLVLQSENFSWYDGAGLMLVLFASHVLRRCLQILLENRMVMKFTPSVVLAAFVLLILGLQFGWPFYRMGNLDFLLISVLLLMGAGYCLEELNWKENRTFSGPAFTFRNAIHSIFLRTKAVRASLLIGFVLKSFFLTALYQTSEEGRSIFLMVIFSSPALLFTYVFNNAWGHFRNTWKLVDGCAGDGITMLKYYLKFLSLPLLIDFLIFLVFLFFEGNIMYYLLVYGTSLVLLVANGFFWSMQSAFYVKKMVMGMKNNTSVSGSIISMLLVGSLVAVDSLLWTGVMAGGYLLLSLSVLVYLVKDYPSYRSRMFQKLYKA